MMALGNNTDQDFHAWYQQHYGDLYSSEFPPRHIFGEYVANIAQELITVAKGHHIQIKYMTNTEIIKVKKRPNEQEYCLIGEQEYFTANFIVFCTGHMVQPIIENSSVHLDIDTMPGQNTLEGKYRKVIISEFSEPEFQLSTLS